MAWQYDAGTISGSSHYTLSKDTEMKASAQAPHVQLIKTPGQRFSGNFTEMQVRVGLPLGAEAKWRNGKRVGIFPACLPLVRSTNPHFSHGSTMLMKSGPCLLKLLHFVNLLFDFCPIPFFAGVLRPGITSAEDAKHRGRRKSKTGRELSRPAELTWWR